MEGLGAKVVDPNVVTGTTPPIDADEPHLSNVLSLDVSL